MDAGNAGASTPQLQLGSLEPVLTPVAEGERIEMLDVLRGLALIGILLMNIEWFNRPIADIGSFDFSLKGLDHAVGWSVRFFIEGKSYRLFSLLFGMGFAIMLFRSEKRGRPTAALFCRRMLFLFLIGCAHLFFLWGGDILKDFAVTGMAWIGLSLGFAMTAAALLLQMHPAFRYLDLASAIGKVLFMLSQYLMAAGYFGFFVTAIQHDFWKRRLRFLAPLGRMALTNYLMHTVLLTTIFYGYAGNLFGRISRAWQMPVAAAIIGAQLVICRLWLKHFRYGPMEWLWRSFTYWQRQPIRV